MFKTLWVVFFLAQAERWRRLECSVFLLCRVGRLCDRRMEAFAEWGWRCAWCGLVCKKCDRKKQQKGWAGKAAKKTTKPVVTQAGIFCWLRETCRCCP